MIVVYKVDRLTRSLADFAKIVEQLDAKQASFVSVTQAFNTTTSMGRLTLNVLLSFAQFEREVMRLTNGDDQSVIRRLLPDSLGSFGELLPVLDVGEALVVGDASLLPTRVRIAEPVNKPDSQTVAFWDEWNSEVPKSDTANAVKSWRRQSSSG